VKEEDTIIVKRAQEDVETLCKLLNNNREKLRRTSAGIFGARRDPNPASPEYKSVAALSTR